MNVSYIGNTACNATKLADFTAEDVAEWGDVFEGNTNTSTCA